MSLGQRRDDGVMGSPMVLSCLGPALRAPAPSTLCYTGAPLPGPWVETTKCTAALHVPRAWLVGNEIGSTVKKVQGSF